MAHKLTYLVAKQKKSSPSFPDAMRIVHLFFLPAAWQQHDNKQKKAIRGAIEMRKTPFPPFPTTTFNP
jgi:hypothetical protein